MILRHDRADRESLVDEQDWPALTSFFRGHGAATLIAPTWLLTAAHVAQSIPSHVTLSVELAGKRFPLARVILHPAYDAAWMAREEDEDDENDEGSSVVDLAVVELALPVTHVHPVAIYEEADEQGQEVWLLGRGECGNGLRGVRGADRALRRVTNRIDVVDASWLKMRFDAPPEGTALEGVCGRGDSGGPAFIQRQHDLLLAGVSSWQQVGGRPLGTYGCVEHYTRVSRCVDWIHTVCATQA